jgi:hypothetical protein
MNSINRRNVIIALSVLLSLNAAAEWKAHDVFLLNGRAAPIQLEARLNMLTEPWNRVVAVPYIIYMPEKDEVLMLVSCDYPHQAMILSSADHGAAWSDPRFVHLGDDGKPDTGMGTSLTYIGGGKVQLIAGKLWESSDYGATWSAVAEVPQTPEGGPWYMWDPLWSEKGRLFETGYTAVRAPGTGPGYQQGFIRFSDDFGKTWMDCVKPPEWVGVSEVALTRAKNGYLVGACRTDIPARMQGETLDHYEGLGVSISKDDGKTWSKVTKLFDWGRHHPSCVLMPDGRLVMTYVVRKGYVDSPDGFPQFGVEAIVSEDNGESWDLDHRYVLHTWVGNRKGPNGWWASCQATSTVLLPDGSLLTAFGTGYRSESVNGASPAPRDAAIVSWRLGDKSADADRTIRDAAFDSDARNVCDPAPFMKIKK